MSIIKSLISVVMPVYNGEFFLSEAIESILNQTYKNFEFIIIDDGSTDKSLEIIQKYALSDNRIIIISRENKGLLVSLNEGINKSKGAYIARMDADDISMPDRFEQQLKLMESEHLDICGGHYLVINDNASINSLNLVPLSQQLCHISLASTVPFAHPSVMIRKNFLLTNALMYGQSKYKDAEDFDLWIRMFTLGAKFGNVDNIILKYRVIPNSLSKINSKNIANDSRKMLNNFLMKNKKIFLDSLKSIPKTIHPEEEVLIVRLIIKLYFKSFNPLLFKYLKNIQKKNIICTFISESMHLSIFKKVFK